MSTSTDVDIDLEFGTITEGLTFEPIPCAAGGICNKGPHDANWLAQVVCGVSIYLCEDRRKFLTRDKEVRCVPSNQPLSHLHPVTDVRWTPIPGQEAY